MGEDNINMMLRTLLAVGIAVATADMTCPSTSAAIACGMKVTTTASASCADVLGEMKARIAGQYGAWHDPHNNGTYSVESYGGTFSTSRLTGDGKYTDKQIFTLTDQSGSCLIEACSRSQVFSIGDAGTNYCDVKMLFCGSKDGCKPVKNDFTVGKETTSKFAQASVDMGSCLKVSEDQVTELAGDETTLYKISSGECGQATLDSKYASYAEKFAGLVEGTCTAQGYTVPDGFCGETCINPNKYFIFKVFERNLTKATDNTPCMEQFTPTGGHYTNYTSTVTHGVPGLSVTLDLYGPV